MSLQMINNVITFFRDKWTLHNKGLHLLDAREKIEQIESLLREDQEKLHQAKTKDPQLVQSIEELKAILRSLRKSLQSVQKKLTRESAILEARKSDLLSFRSLEVAEEPAAGPEPSN